MIQLTRLQLILLVIVILFVIIFLSIFAPTTTTKFDTANSVNITAAPLITTINDSILNSTTSNYSIHARLRDMVYGINPLGIKCNLFKLNSNNQNEDLAEVSRFPYYNDNSSWELLIDTVSDEDGGCDLSTDSSHPIGSIYKVFVDTGSYYTTRNLTTYYPFVVMIFEKLGDVDRIRTSIILSPFTYSCYRGRTPIIVQ